MLVVATMALTNVLLARNEVRTIMAQQYSTRLQSQKAWVDHLLSLRANAGPGVSYVNLMPLVTCAVTPGQTQDRTNLGINNFSQGAIYTGGTNAYVEIHVYDKDGVHLEATGSTNKFITATVAANQMYQINNIVSTDPAASQFKIGSANPFYGWALIFSDQPVTAWASVIHSVYSGGTLVVDDPAVELAVADQIFKPLPFIEKTGTRLAILSALKSGKWTSSLAVANVGGGDGTLTIKFYGNDGIEYTANRLTNIPIAVNGMYVNPDIRNGVPTFGMITIEAIDPTPTDGASPRLLANSIVRSTTGDASFFEAFALPPIAEDNLSVDPPIRATKAIAGIWTGNLTGVNNNVNCSVTLELYQERDQLYGTLHVDSGKFPVRSPAAAPDDYFLIQGEINNGTYLIYIQDPFENYDPFMMFSLRMWAASIRPEDGQTMKNQAAFIYYDENNKSDMGSFSLTRTGHTIN
jgi:hypothetical protein